MYTTCGDFKENPVKITKRQLRRLIKESTSDTRVAKIAQKAHRLLNEDALNPFGGDMPAAGGKLSDEQQNEYAIEFDEPLKNVMSEKLNNPND